VRKIRITDVAARAGVSIKTVSRVVNREPNVRGDTRERVLGAIAALNYTPNPFARSLAGSRAFVVGLLYDNPSSSYVIDIQRGALKVCRRECYDLLIHPCDYLSSELPAEVGHVLRQSKVDGFLLTPPLSDHQALLAALREARSSHLSPAEALDLAIRTAGIPELLRSWPEPGRRLANLEALRAEARAYEDLCRARRAAATVLGLVAHLGELDAEAPQATPTAEDAVQVTTWHGAKGLEWPVVVLADLDFERAPDPFDVAVEPAPAPTSPATAISATHKTRRSANNRPRRLTAGSLRAPSAACAGR